MEIVQMSQVHPINLLLLKTMLHRILLYVIPPGN